MAKEIERKYLLRNDGWRGLGEGLRLTQGYLCSDKQRTVRVRIAGESAFLTIKGPVRGATRSEFEYRIPLEDARQMLDLCERPLIDKTRHRIDHEGLVWEVDEFHGENRGLVLAECELETEDQAVAPPEWIGREVTDDFRYYNSSLMRNPYSRWKGDPP